MSFARDQLAVAVAVGSGTGVSGVATAAGQFAVNSFTATTSGGQNFDIYMSAGGFGGFNACDPGFSGMKSASGLYLYSTFPEQGEPGSGGLNAATQLDGCKNAQNLVTAATLSSATCVSNITNACHLFASSTLTSQALADSVQSCVKSNDAASLRTSA